MHGIKENSFILHGVKDARSRRNYNSEGNIWQLLHSGRSRILCVYSVTANWIPNRYPCGLSSANVPRFWMISFVLLHWLWWSTTFSITYSFFNCEWKHWVFGMDVLELVCVLLMHLFVLCVLVFDNFSSSWCRGLAAVCDCGTPWTFLLTFLIWSKETLRYQNYLTLLYLFFDLPLRLAVEYSSFHLSFKSWFMFVVLMYWWFNSPSRGPNTFYVYEPQQNLGWDLCTGKTSLSPPPPQ